MYVTVHTCKQPLQAVISTAGYGLTGKRLQPARIKNLYGGFAYSLEKLRWLIAAYGGGYVVYYRRRRYITWPQCLDVVWLYTRLVLYNRKQSERIKS